MSPTGVFLVVALCFTTVGALLWLAGFGVGRGRRRGWVVTRGRWTRFASGMTRAWVVEFRSHDGGEHRVFPTMNGTSLAPSGTVPVAYDPRDPRRAVIDTPYHRGDVLKIVGLVLAGIGVVLAVLAAVVDGTPPPR